MPIEEKKYAIEANNDWAKNMKEEHLHIYNALSGRRGYFCIGCDKEMEAVIRRKNPNHKSYFRHIPVDITKDEKKCTFSNREYRETLATDILQRLKAIKVPSVYKYPPKGFKGYPNLLEKSKFIQAHKVRSQITFYEDNEGIIRSGKNPEVAERYLLIRPDVVFYDEKDRPILFIELVVTHKVTEEKKIKLRRLGIDTVSIIVPKSSAQELEDNFKSTNKVKWEYNGSEADTKYVQVTAGSGEGVLEFDEEQRRIFDESIACRKARLNNIIRTIGKCLRSESYRRTERDFEREISRVEKAARRENKGLAELEEQYDAEVYDSIRGKFEALDGEKKQLGKEEGKIKIRYSELEKRYLTKREELTASLGKIENFTELRGDLESRIEDIRRNRGKIEERVIQEHTRAVGGNTSQLPRVIKNILEAKRVVSLYPAVECEEESYIRAREFFNSGAWKNWKDS